MKRILRLVKKFRRLRKTAKNFLHQLTECQTKFSELTKEIAELQRYKKRMESVFRYGVEVRYIPEDRVQQITIRLSEQALKFVRDPQNMIKDVAAEMVTKLLR